MVKNKSKQLPKFDSIKDLANYFDENDFGDYWEKMPEANFEIEITKQKHLIKLEEEVAINIGKIAKTKHTSSEILINTWLKEKIQSL